MCKTDRQYPWRDMPALDESTPRWIVDWFQEIVGCGSAV